MKHGCLDRCRIGFSDWYSTVYRYLCRSISHLSILTEGVDVRQLKSVTWSRLSVTTRNAWWPGIQLKPHDGSGLWQCQRSAGIVDEEGFFLFRADLRKALLPAQYTTLCPCQGQTKPVWFGLTEQPSGSPMLALCPNPFGVCRQNIVDERAENAAELRKLFTSVVLDRLLWLAGLQLTSRGSSPSEPVDQCTSSGTLN